MLYNTWLFLVDCIFAHVLSGICFRWNFHLVSRAFHKRQRSINSMDWQNITFAFDYLVSAGVTFSTEHRVALQSSLILLQKDNQFSRVQFCARIEGVDNDYYIACGIGKDYIKDRVFFYSINTGLEWIILTQPSDLVRELGCYTKGRFIGDPTADSETECTATGLDDIEEGEQWAFMKEEERLAATVAAITRESAVVPRGALFKHPTGIVSENKTFTGLTKAEASHFHSYYHLAQPSNQWDKNIVARADYNLTLDFLDSIANDCPIGKMRFEQSWNEDPLVTGYVRLAGAWTIQINRVETLAIVRSLYWPGAVSIHVLETPQFGWFYNGTGRKNWDLPFMIPPVPAKSRLSIPEVYPVLAEDAGEAGGDSTMAFAKRQYSFRATPGAHL